MANIMKPSDLIENQLLKTFLNGSTCHGNQNDLEKAIYGNIHIKSQLHCTWHYRVCGRVAMSYEVVMHVGSMGNLRTWNTGPISK